MQIAHADSTYSVIPPGVSHDKLIPLVETLIESLRVYSLNLEKTLRAVNDNARDFVTLLYAHECNDTDCIYYRDDIYSMYMNYLASKYPRFLSQHKSENETDSPPAIKPGQYDKSSYITLYIISGVEGGIIFIGTITNVLSIIVLLRKSFRKTTMSLYLITLAVADTFVLYCDAGQIVLRHLKLYVASSNAECKITRFLAIFPKQLSSWIIVNLTLERTAAVLFPLHCKEWFTRLKAANFLLINVLILLMLNVQILWTTAFDGNMCMYQINLDIMSFIWPKVEVMIYSILPSIILIVCNTMICVKMYKSYLLRNSEDSTSADDTKLRRTIIVLLTLTFVFFVTTFPAVSISLFSYTASTIDYVINTLNPIFMCLQCINYACNFFLYCISGSKFRNELVAMCTICYHD